MLKRQIDLEIEYRHNSETGGGSGKLLFNLSFYSPLMCSSNDLHSDATNFGNI